MVSIEERIAKRLGMESSLEMPQIGNDEEIAQIFAQHMRAADEYLNSGLD